MNRIPSNTLIYDRDCELCRWGQGLVRRWDRRGRIGYLAFQDPRFQELFPGLDRSDPEGIWPFGVPPRAMLFINQRGEAHAGMEAFRAMLPSLPGGWFLRMLFWIPGVPWLAVRLYEWIARNRYRWFGPARDA